MESTKASCSIHTAVHIQTIKDLGACVSLFILPSVHGIEQIFSYNSYINYVYLHRKLFSVVGNSWVVIT